MGAVRDELKKSTDGLHQSVDGLFSDLLNPRLAIGEYLKCLQILFVYHREFERQLAELFSASAVAKYYSPERLKSNRLKKDLDELGGPVIKRPFDWQLDGATDAYLWGAVYVLEGSALGGQMIAKSIGQSLQLSPGNGVSFFYGDGPLCGKKWQAFITVLESEVPIQEVPTALAGARHAFSVLSRLHTHFI